MEKGKRNEVVGRRSVIWDIHKFHSKGDQLLIHEVKGKLNVTKKSIILK